MLSLLLSFLTPMLVSRIMSLYQYCTFIHMIHKVVNITTTEAKLLAIQCSIN